VQLLLATIGQYALFRSSQLFYNARHLRAIANDPDVFPEPHKFKPQRWINESGQLRDDLRFFTYGFGRR
jgi:hypothetical protein